MIEIREINTNDTDYTFVERLLTEAFPLNERRDSNMQRLYTDGREQFHCCLITDDGKAVGLFNYWDFEDFRYVEHFAVDGLLRNSGIGRKAFDAFLALSDKPVVLEVERPADDLCRRRIAFYQRQGMVLWHDKDYVQPPYREGGESVQMLLMASPSLNSESDYNQIVKQIHSEVYNA